FALRDPETHRAAAEAWRRAKSEEDRVALEQKHGVRWSELLRLKYWDPTRFMVIDTMHLLFLGLLETHCRNVWGMS
ncbi:hypothetical protein SISNIDRAFT_390477, partial [Sistotremastrum niveocremeum HHB9708]